MFIVPFTHNIIKHNKLNVNIIKILTISGKELWEENNSLDIDNDILNPNDIYRSSSIINYDDTLYLCEVDIKKTKIDDFYKWEEVSINDSEIFCWRTYYYFVDNKEMLWLEIPNSEKIGKYNTNDILKKIIEIR